MESNQPSHDKPWFIFLPIFIGLGTGMGALLGNVGVGIVLGVGLGSILNLAAYYLQSDR
jgi:hypothetical protein